MSRARRKRALTAQSSSRWAGAITRTSEDQWQLAARNLGAQKSGLRVRIATIRARLAVPAGGRAGRVRGYASAAERHAKRVRLQVLQARLAAVDRRLAAGRVSVVRGGRALLGTRGRLAAAGLTQAQWRREWEAARLFLTADGEKDKAFGNETIRWNPGEGWLEIRLPGPLARLANGPHGRYRLSCPVGFSYRGGEVAAQAATGAVRYDISYDPVRDRWYLDASWRTSPGPASCLDELRAYPVLAVDLNHGHLAVWVVTPDGNPAGPPALTRRARPPLPGPGRRPADRAVPGPAGPDGRQRGPGGHRRRPGLHLPLGGRALARPAAGTSFPGPRDWPPCGRRGDRQACARPPGAATGRRDRRRPADQPPESCPPSTRGHPHQQGRQAPPGPAAATTVAQDRRRPLSPASISAACSMKCARPDHGSGASAASPARAATASIRSTNSAATGSSLVPNRR